MQTINYFFGCNTKDEVKKRFRELAMVHHPDKGGNTATMQEINREYAFCMDCITRSDKPEWNEGQYTWAATIDERLREVIEQLIHIPGIEIEVCGMWIWISGDTKPVKDVIKNIRVKGNENPVMKWASKKMQWYYPGIPASNKGNTWSIDEIRHYYGSQKVESELLQQVS